MSAPHDSPIRALPAALHTLTVSAPCALCSQLNLWGNDIGPEGAKALADALKVNASLTSLDVGHNSIDQKQALKLVSIFKEKDQMKSVGLAGCSLGVKGAKAVAEYARVSASLTQVLAFCQHHLTHPSEHFLLRCIR